MSGGKFSDLLWSNHTEQFVIHIYIYLELSEKIKQAMCILHIFLGGGGDKYIHTHKFLDFQRGWGKVNANWEFFAIF